MNDAAFAFEPVVKRRAREGGQKGHLYFVKPGLFHEVEDIIEHFGRVAIQAKYKTAVDSDAAGLDFGDGGFVAVPLLHLPVGVQFDAVQAGAAQALQANVPPGLSNVVGIAAGDSHSLALKADGTVVAWGGNNNGQTNVPAT